MHYDMCVERKEDKENMNKFLKGAMIVGLSVAMVGCNNPKIRPDYLHVELMKKFLANDIVVITTGCSAQAAGKAGLMDTHIQLTLHIQLNTTVTTNIHHCIAGNQKDRTLQPFIKGQLCFGIGMIGPHRIQHLVWTLWGPIEG